LAEIGTRGLSFAVLARVAVVRNHRGDARRGRAPERVDHHAQLDQVLVDRRARRLHDEDVRAADVLVDLERHFRVRKAMQAGDAHGDAEVLGNLLRQRRMGASRKQFELAVDHYFVGGTSSPPNPPYTLTRATRPLTPGRQVTLRSRGARRFARAQYPSDLPMTSDL
jgi:hypothetical protein